MTQLSETHRSVRPDWAGQWTTLAFTVTLILSAGLLFVVQPMFAKLALPLFGGSPAVWNTAMLFFQAALLCGYAYAHAIASYLSIRAQVILHVCLLIAALFALPIGLPRGWVPSPGTYPAFVLLGAMALAIGVPFLLVSATAPLLQNWYARSNAARSSDPYFLYAASNFGSFVALLAYPFVVEPTLRLGDQTFAWSFGFAGLMVLIAACGLATLAGAGEGEAPSAAGQAIDRAAAPVSLGERLHWIALAFVPSSLLLGTTTYITTDIAAVPLLWVLPLALYLLSFVIAFAAKPPLRHAWVVRVMPLAVASFPLLHGLLASFPIALVTIHLTLLFMLALMCHGELARLRPPSARLTEFYLLVSVGGVLGGFFNAIVAPLSFADVYEYPLAVMLACLLLPGFGRQPRPVIAVLAAIPVFVAALAAQSFEATTPIVTALGTGALVIAVYGTFEQPLRFGLAMGAILSAPFIWRAVDGTRLEQSRSFFGVHTVYTDATGRIYLMRHGTTLHGAQWVDPTRSREPLSYYSPRGPVAQLFGVLDPARFREVGIVGLGTGSLSCYRQPGQNWSYYEIDPTVIETALNARHFTFVKSCAPDSRMVLGDARLSLKGEPGGRYDLLVLDAFSSDAIPIHLLTREAFGIYFDKLREDGVLFVHFSNRHLDLTPVLANAAAAVGVEAVLQGFVPTRDEVKDWIVGAVWMALSRNQGVISRLKSEKGWQQVKPDLSIPLWSDDYSNILRVLK
jgi:hypothetical protein